MQAEFEMSLMGELKFFLGIQINQTPEGTYIHQSKYVRELLKKFDLSECKSSKIPMHSRKRRGKQKGRTEGLQRYDWFSSLSDGFKA